jgi:outer membrane protein TolC
LQDYIIPEEKLLLTIKETLRTNELMTANPSINNHPKITALETKVQMLDVERKLKANMLLPRIDLGYSYLSEPSAFDQYKFQDYKVGLNFYFPVFLRKERGSLKIAKFKMQDAQFDLDLERVQLTNKINAQQTEISSLEKQKSLIDDLVNDNQTMLKSEERLFTFGESSIFLINTRENNLVTAQISQLTIENRYFNSNAELFKIMANPD